MTDVILGSSGQLGVALRKLLPDASIPTRHELDLRRDRQMRQYPWPSSGVIYNASGYTAVDQAEDPKVQDEAWELNVGAVATMARIANERGLTLAHVSSDYVFDGSQPLHFETEPTSPVGIYARTKAGGETAAALARKHYIVRTSWLIGDGDNFVRTMMKLAARGIQPEVVCDQFGRLTFTDDLAEGLVHLVATSAPYGIYNLSGEGDICSWAEIAQAVFEVMGRHDLKVKPITTLEWAAKRPATAPRPRHSGLDLTKIESTGFTPRHWWDSMSEYVRAQLCRP